MRPKNELSLNQLLEMIALLQAPEVTALLFGALDNMDTEKITHYGRGNNRKPFEYFTLQSDKQLGVIVYGWGIYENSSVLAGQQRKVYCASFPNSKEAEKVYGKMNFSSPFIEREISLDHLPDENTPVAGGMYPDDIEDGY
jgi:hypothetical protein